MTLNDTLPNQTVVVHRHHATGMVRQRLMDLALCRKPLLQWSEVHHWVIQLKSELITRMSRCAARKPLVSK